MDSNKEQRKLMAKRSLTTQEKMAIERTKQRNPINPGPLFRACEGSDSDLELVTDEKLEKEEAADLLDARIMQATGASNPESGLQLITSMTKAAVPTKAKGKELARQLNGLAQAMQALAPQDEYEGQLIAQLIVLHEQAMDWLGRAMRTERVDFANVYLNGASKLLTRHHETLDMLLKYRRKGEQRVHVEHVHVYGGGQAIVGNVSTGDRMNKKTEEGPHAKV
ncbi:hypothetical protein BN1013_00780 [Candidatus Rubidus massiliensis]|nr:hypothetical protein BN1013_00780 [Candidatus Rubidus massiliensis]